MYEICEADNPSNAGEENKKNFLKQKFYNLVQ
jgi:hypothetical protein